MKKITFLSAILCLTLLFAGCSFSVSSSTYKNKKDRDHKEESYDDKDSHKDKKDEYSDDGDEYDDEDYNDDNNKDDDYENDEYDDKDDKYDDWGDKDDKDDNDDNDDDSDRVSLKKSSKAGDWSERTVKGSDKDTYDFDDDSVNDRDRRGESDDFPQSAAEYSVEQGSGSDDYLLPDSDSRYLTEDDLEDLTTDQLRIARNEIYARHGRKFTDPDLQAYFDGKSWYYGTTDPKKFDEKLLNDYETYNRDFIVKYEKKHGKKK